MLAVSGDEYDGQVGHELAETAGEFDAADFGHENVGDDDLEGLAGEGVQGFFAVVDGVDGEACFAERLGEVLVDERIVFGEQEAAAGHGRGGRQGGGDGQVDAEGCAVPGSGFALDAPVALVDDAVDGGESEAGGMGGVFGGEEGFEDAAAGGFVHADAGIGDGEDDAGLGGSAVELERFERSRSGGDSQGATRGHGGAGIVGQVHEDEVELIGIDDDGGEGSSRRSSTETPEPRAR